MNSEDTQKAIKLVEKVTEIFPARADEDENALLACRLDALSSIIDRIRIEKKLRSKKIEQLHISNLTIFEDQNLLHIHLADKPMDSHHSSPSLLSMPLLVHIYNERSGNDGILTTIRTFIDKFADRWTPYDLLRTETGVLRLETNIRFAAKALRGSGLLLSSREECFKHWRLSLAGILTAYRITDQKLDPWCQPALENHSWTSLPFYGMNFLLMHSKPHELIDQLEKIAKYGTPNPENLRKALDRLNILVKEVAAIHRDDIYRNIKLVKLFAALECEPVGKWLSHQAGLPKGGQAEFML